MWKIVILIISITSKHSIKPRECLKNITIFHNVILHRSWYCKKLGHYLKKIQVLQNIGQNLSKLNSLKNLLVL